MSEVQRHSTGSGSSLSRSVERALAKIDARKNVEIAGINAVAEAQATKVDCVAFVGRRAMFDITMLSQIEVQLTQIVPHSSARVAAIADMTAIAMTEIVVDTARRIG